MMAVYLYNDDTNAYINPNIDTDTGTDLSAFPEMARRQKALSPVAGLASAMACPTGYRAFLRQRGI